MNFYLGTFVVAFATLAFEVTLVRLLSVVTWYHLAFLAISTAMLGMTAGAVRVYLDQETFRGENLVPSLRRACLQYAIAVPACLLLLCLLPLDLYGSLMAVVAFFAATACCSAPFYFSGIVITASLTKAPVPIGRLYGSDLVGASLGCLFVLGGLEVLDAPSLIILCGGLGVLAAMLYRLGQSSYPERRFYVLLLATFIGAALLNSQTLRGIQPLMVKGRPQPAFRDLLQAWNSFSRVAVQPRTIRHPWYWGASPVAPQPKVEQFIMNIDGEAGTVIQRFGSPHDIDFLRYDVTTAGYFLGRNGPACIIGVGGGRDIQSALLFGHTRVVGVEVNPIFANLLRGPFREFAGVGGRPDVELVVDEARSYLTRTFERFAVIQMSMIDTWASTGAGAFSLSENGLYTLEAWTVFLRRLTDDGLLMVSRWHDPRRISETGRAVSLAVAALLKLGVTEPSRNLALITTNRLCTLLLSPRPFTAEDIAALKDIGNRLHYRVLHLPGEPPEDAVLRQIVLASSTEELRRATSGRDLDYTPPTDETPYFFNMLKLGNLGAAFAARSRVVRGNLTASITLLILLFSLAVLTVVTIVVPLLRRGTEPRGNAFWSGALYFSLIGCGFMLAEIALLEKFSLFLGHPVYALGILLFALILSTGVGSFLSERLPLTRAPWMFVYPLATASAILGLRYLVEYLLAALIAKSTPLKIAITVMTIVPFGILLGLFFPTGMRLAQRSTSHETPWYWALNGIFGVLCSALAVLLSIYAGISVNFYIAAACYGLVALPIGKLKRADR